VRIYFVSYPIEVSFWVLGVETLPITLHLTIYANTIIGLHHRVGLSIAMETGITGAVLDVLYRACSQDSSVLKPAEEQLRQWETQPGFYTTLAVS
jgi:hypothetical protein